MEINKCVPIKKGSIGRPKPYRGAKVSNIHLLNQVDAWAMNSSQYIQEAVSNAKDWMKKNQPDNQWRKHASAPFSTKYHPEIDFTPELDDEEGSYFQLIIGVL
jgi:hypothetical protein